MKHTTIPIRNTISAAGIDDKTLSLLWTQRWCWHWNYEAVESEPGPSRPIYSFGKILIKLYVFDGDSPTLSSHKSLPPASQPPPSSSSSAPPASCPPYTNWRRVEDKHFWQMEVLCSIYEGSQGHFGYKKKRFWREICHQLLLCAFAVNLEGKCSICTLVQSWWGFHKCSRGGVF